MRYLPLPRRRRNFADSVRGRWAEVDQTLQAVVSWRTLVVAMIVFGFAPGVVLRVIVRLYPKASPRRRELLGELPHVPWVERPFWVAQHLETALAEGVPARLRRVRNSPFAFVAWLGICVVVPAIVVGLVFDPAAWIRVLTLLAAVCGMAAFGRHMSRAFQGLRPSKRAVATIAAICVFVWSFGVATETHRPAFSWVGLEFGTALAAFAVTIILLDRRARSAGIRIAMPYPAQWLTRKRG